MDQYQPLDPSLLCHLGSAFGTALPGSFPAVSMRSWSSQHMQSSMSAPCASSTTVWQGCVSPVNTMLPPGRQADRPRGSRNG